MRGGAARRRAALVGVLAAAAAAMPAARPARLPAARGGGGGMGPSSIAPAPAEHGADLPWRLLVELVRRGGPNGRLGLVQAQHIFGKVATGSHMVRSGLVRVRIPASLVRQGDDGWRHERFGDAWWMEVMGRIGVPFKTVAELWPRFTDEQHAAHAARIVRRVNPDVLIVGNEVNAVEERPGADAGAEIERYLDRWEAMHAAARAVSGSTRLQLYGEAYTGEPIDPNAFLRRVLAALRRRNLPLPDVAGFHVYDRAEVIPDRASGYRRLLADYGLRIPVSIEELGPAQGVVDDLEARRFAAQPPEDGTHFGSRLEELRAHGWLTEAEHAGLVAQHLATAAATADQAQIFCAIDFDAEVAWRRGLVSNVYDRARPALKSFRFMQRLLNDLESARWTPPAEPGGVARVDVVRRDGLAASIHWSTPATHLPAGETPPARLLEVPPHTFVCDAGGELLAPPRTQRYTLELPAATSTGAGGPVRVLM